MTCPSKRCYRLCGSFRRCSSLLVAMSARRSWSVSSKSPTNSKVDSTSSSTPSGNASTGSTLPRPLLVLSRRPLARSPERPSEAAESPRERRAARLEVRLRLGRCRAPREPQSKRLMRKQRGGLQEQRSTDCNFRERCGAVPWPDKSGCLVNSPHRAIKIHMARCPMRRTVIASTPIPRRSRQRTSMSSLRRTSL